MARGKYMKPRFIGTPKREDVRVDVSASGASRGRDARNQGPWKIHAPASVHLHFWFNEQDKHHRTKSGGIEFTMQEARTLSLMLIRMCEAAERFQAEAEAKVAAQEE